MSLEIITDNKHHATAHVIRGQSRSAEKITCTYLTITSYPISVTAQYSDNLTV